MTRRIYIPNEIKYVNPSLKDPNYIDLMRTPQKILTPIIFLLLTGNLFAQTIISPSIGFDYSTINDPERDLVDYYGGANRIKYTVAYNLNFEKFLSPKLSLSFNGNLTEKRIKKTGVGPIIFNPTAGLHFFYFRGSVLLKYYPKPYLYFGIGPNKNYTSTTVVHRRYGESSKGRIFKINTDSFGLGIFTGFIYKHFFAELSYNHGFEEERNLGGFIIINTINSTAMTVGYRFNISKKKRW